MGTSGDRIVVSDGGAEHIMTDVHGIDKTSGAVAITVGATEPVTVIADVRARQNKIPPHPHRSGVWGGPRVARLPQRGSRQVS